MHAGRRYSIFQTLRWTKKYIFYFLILDSIPVLLYLYADIYWLHIPWQPISLIGIAVAFYLGFKNNSAYERLWEARKIWGGIVNASRSFTVMARDFINNDHADPTYEDEELKAFSKALVHRHVAWLRALAVELRKVKEWEHTKTKDVQFRELFKSTHSEEKFNEIKPYLTEEDFTYVMSKGNRSSHILSAQSKHMMKLRRAGVIEHFRHLQMQELITEFYALQGKSERIKNFPFPRQYASVNYYFVVLFIVLLPFGMMDIFTGAQDDYLIWLSIPFSVVGSWVFWMMEMISEYSENPFEGLFNDVPITSLARGIEIDIRQMLDETDLPEPLGPNTDFNVVL